YLTGGWTFHINICRAVGILGYALTGTTIITITAIAWNRYKLVVDSKMYHVIFRRRKMAVMLAATWLIPVAFLQPAVFGVWGHFGFIPVLSSCNLDLDNSSQTFKIFLLIVRAAIPCGLIIYFYSSIYITTRASRLRLQNRRRNSSSNNNNNNSGRSSGNYQDCCGNNEVTQSISEANSNNPSSIGGSGGSTTAALTNCLTAEQSNNNNNNINSNNNSNKNNRNNYHREMRLTRMMIAIFLVFVVSYFPCTISSAIDMSHTLSKTFHMFCQTTIFLGSAVNPLLYGFMNSQFRTAYYNIIMCSMLTGRARQKRYGSSIAAMSTASRRKKQGKGGDIKRAVKTGPVAAVYSILPRRHKKVTPSLSHMSGKSTSPKSNTVNTRVANLSAVPLEALKHEKI
ncbi:hypothetical protein EGW08_022427, partial [Elysia chlorotica]